MQRCSTFNQALYSLLHLYIGDLEQSRKGNESNSTGIFQPDFYDRGAEESKFYKFLWNSDRGNPWISLPATKSKG